MLDARRRSELEHPSHTALSSFADGQLHGEDRLAVSRHLPDCPVCRQVVAELGQIAERLRAVLRTRGLPEADCPDDEVISAYCDGTLPSGVASMLKTHIASCSYCEEQAAALSALLVLTASGALTRFDAGAELGVCQGCGSPVYPADRSCQRCAATSDGAGALTGIPDSASVAAWLSPELRSDPSVVRAATSVVHALPVPSGVLLALMAGGILGGTWVFEKRHQETLSRLARAWSASDEAQFQAILAELRVALPRTA